MKLAALTLMLLTFLVANAQEYVNLSKYVMDNHLTDFGYGLDRQDSVIISDSLFTLNRFIDTAMYFRECKSDTVSTIIDGQRYDIRLAKNAKTGNARSISIYRSGKEISQYHYPAKSADWPIASHLIRYCGHDYYSAISCTSFSPSGSTTTNKYSFVMIDLRSLAVMSPPEELSTPSLLCLRDYDGDGLPDLLLCQARWSYQVRLYRYVKDSWQEDMGYIITLGALDGWLHYIVAEESRVPRALKQAVGIK